jgi:hypothetical protein
LAEGDPELMCLWVTAAERSSSDASTLADRNILHPPQVSFLRKKEEGKLACAFLAPFEFPHLFPSLFLQCSFWGGVDMPVSQVESTRVQEELNVILPVYDREDAEELVRKVTLLNGELA